MPRIATDTKETVKKTAFRIAIIAIVLYTFIRHTDSEALIYAIVEILGFLSLIAFDKLFGGVEVLDTEA